MSEPTNSTARTLPTPVQVRAEVISTKRVGDYQAITLVAPGVSEGARPGQFVAVRVGGPDTALVTRRALSLAGVSASGPYGGTIELVVAVRGLGTAWLAQRRPHDQVDVVGPLGRPFLLPRAPASALLVGGGYGAAPLIWLGQLLRARGVRLAIALGAATADRLYGVLDAKRMATTVAFTTEDGSTGTPGRVTDVLPSMLARTDADVVYACGPMGLLAAVTHIAGAHDVLAQCAVEELMACGVGVCMACVLPVVGEDGRTRMTRACLDGPVFPGHAVRWDALGQVPADCVGAPVRSSGDVLAPGDGHSHG